MYYYEGKYRLSAGNPQIFPTRKAAEIYKKHYEAYAWFNKDLVIEEVEYDGVPLNKPKMYKGKEIVDKEHYFGLDAHEVGEYFTEDMIDSFMDLLPPACMRSDCSQIGEPCSSRIDENGKGRTTYSTFKKVDDGIWEYCGDCFRGENYMHGKDIPYVR